MLTKTQKSLHSKKDVNLSSPSHKSLREKIKEILTHPITPPICPFCGYKGKYTYARTGVSVHIRRSHKDKKLNRLDTILSAISEEAEGMKKVGSSEFSCYNNAISDFQERVKV